MTKQTQHDIYTNPMWSVIGAYPTAIVRTPTRWERLALAWKRWTAWRRR